MEYRELQSDTTRHQEQGRDVSDIPSIKAVDVQLQYCDRNELWAWVTEHAAGAARDPRRIIN